MKAKAHGMTVTELRAHQKKVRTEKKKTKARLRAKEREEKTKLEEFKIEQKYKRKRKRVKEGGSTLKSASDLIMSIGGSSGPGQEDPFGLFGSSKKKKKKKKSDRLEFTL